MTQRSGKIVYFKLKNGGTPGPRTLDRSSIDDTRGRNLNTLFFLSFLFLFYIPFFFSYLSFLFTFSSFLFTFFFFIFCFPFSFCFGWAICYLEYPQFRRQVYTQKTKTPLNLGILLCLHADPNLFKF